VWLYDGILQAQCMAGYLEIFPSSTNVSQAHPACRLESQIDAIEQHTRGRGTEWVSLRPRAPMRLAMPPST
jgi:hypothetical protein